MPDVNQSLIVEFTPGQMFTLVDAVEDYPQFLPWCSGATLIHRDPARTRATLSINYHGIRRSFTTENLKREPGEMRIQLVEGPFSRLEGSWHFTPLADRACRIQFKLHYEFAGRILDKLISPVFHHIASTLVDAFVKRAEQVYRSERPGGER